MKLLSLAAFEVVNKANDEIFVNITTITFQCVINFLSEDTFLLNLDEPTSSENWKLRNVIMLMRSPAQLEIVKITTFAFQCEMNYPIRNPNLNQDKPTSEN